MKKLKLTPVAAAPQVGTDSCCGTVGHAVTATPGAVPPPGAHIDPVCGMTVKPETAAGSYDYHGTTLLLLRQVLPRALQGEPRGIPPRGRSGTAAIATDTRRSGHGILLPDGSRGPAGSPGRLSEMRHGARAGPVERPADADGIHLSDAPRDRPRRARRLPDLRHGARASPRHRRGLEPRARRHDPADVARSRARPAGLPAGDGRHGAGHGARRPPRHAADELDRPRLRDARRLVVRLAVLPARLGIDRQPPQQHVHADRARRRRRVRVQRRGNRWRRTSFRKASASMASSKPTSTPRS